jgi:hypothetical protein
LYSPFTGHWLRLSPMEPQSNEEEILCLAINGTVLFRSKAWMKFQRQATMLEPCQLAPFYFLDEGQEREGFRLALQHSARTCANAEFACSLTEASGNRVERKVRMYPSSVETEIVCCVFRPLPDQPKPLQEVNVEMKDSPNKRFRSTLSEVLITSCGHSRSPKILSNNLTALKGWKLKSPHSAEMGSVTLDTTHSSQPLLRASAFPYWSG